MFLQQQIIYKLIIGILLLTAGNIAATAQKLYENFVLSEPYLYKNGYVSFTNRFIKESKKDSSLLTDAYRPKGIYSYEVTGARSTICFTAYPQPYKLSNGLSLPERYEESKQVDLNPENLQVRISRNGKTEQEWKNIGLAAPSIDSFIHYVPTKEKLEIFLLADLILQTNDIVVVDGKLSTDTTILFTYYIRKIEKIIHPRLISFAHEWDGTESRISPQMINKHILNREAKLRALDRSYLEWYDGMKIRNERIAPASRFIYYFAKFDTTFADSTLEYRFLGGRYADSAWIKTGHQIMVDGLTGNEHYSLEVRYARYPERIETYTYYTNPYWYQRNWIKWVAGSALLVLILLLIIAGYRRRLAKEKAKKAGLADRLRNMQTQLNPHFIFNALGSIQALMNKQENDKAHQYLSTFGNLLRNVLTNSNHDNTTLDQEIKSLEAYLQLEQLRFRFQYSITVAADMQTTIVSLPVMLLQPLVENAVRHGIAGMEEKGQIRISFTKEASNLLVAIEDNGKGFDTTQPTTGYGLKLVREKIQLINTLQEQQAIHYDLHSTGAGTTVLLTFKNWLA